MYIIGKRCGEKMKDYSEYFKGPNLKEAQKRSRKQVDHLKDAFEIPSDMVSVGKGKTYYKNYMIYKKTFFIQKYLKIIKAVYFGQPLLFT